MYSHTSRQWRKFAIHGSSFRIIDSNLLILNFFSNEAEMLTDIIPESTEQSVIIPQLIRC